MKLTSFAEALWGERARFLYLFIASVILLFTLLGAREIWTQEHRWADIVLGMFYRHDFLHPYLGENAYYDKPLLSYWLIAAIAKLTGVFTTWTLRLPSALSGLLAIWAIYQLGCTLKDKQLGMVSGWILLTTFYFLFWARTSSADMLNLAGSLLAIAWYMTIRNRANFFDYTIFFIIVALTSLCKGLTGVIVPGIAVFADLCLQNSWRRHFRLPLFLSMIPAIIIYLLPFWASSYFNTTTHYENGLYLVYRENFLRYFQPFDHRGPIYTYFIYLPIYMLPWAVFFIPAFFASFFRWRTMTENAKWVALTLLLLFLFFTLSGSRRSYYVLPMVPFAILFTADWILSGTKQARRYLWSAGFVAFSFALLLVLVDLLPAWYYGQFGVSRFASLLQTEAEKVKPWKTWNIITLDSESKLNFYLRLPPSIKNYGIKGGRRDAQTAETLAQAWPVLENKPADTIFISRRLYKPLIQKYFVGYRLVEMPAQNLPLLNKHEINAPIAFIPEKLN